MEVADKVIFVGDYAFDIIRAEINPGDDSLMAFEFMYELNEYLQQYYQSGDLIFLKGNRTFDHSGRLMMARKGDIKCWRQFCDRSYDCYQCNLRMKSYIPGQGKEEKRYGKDRKIRIEETV